MPVRQRPSLPIAIGTTSYRAGSSAAITAVAERSETSCAPDLPPWRTPTRIRRIMAGCYIGRCRRQGRIAMARGGKFLRDVRVVFPCDLAFLLDSNRASALHADSLHVTRCVLSFV